MKHGSLQLDSQGRLRHFLTIQGLNRQLLTDILDTAEPLRLEVVEAP